MLFCIFHSLLYVNFYKNGLSDPVNSKHIFIYTYNTYLDNLMDFLMLKMIIIVYYIKMKFSLPFHIPTIF